MKIYNEIKYLNIFGGIVLDLKTDQLVLHKQMPNDKTRQSVFYVVLTDEFSFTLCSYIRTVILRSESSATLNVERHLAFTTAEVFLQHLIV